MTFSVVRPLQFLKRYLPLHSLKNARHLALIDSLAQLVEHNTFNVGVMGSSPMRVTKGVQMMYPFFVDYNGVANKVDMVGVNIQCQKIGEIVPERSLYFLIPYQL